MRWQILAGLLIAEGLAAQTIHLKTRTVEASEVRSVAGGPAKRWKASRTHYLLQFPTAINDDIRDALAFRGAVITSSVPDNAVIVAVPEGFSTEGLEVSYASELNPDDKVSPISGTHGNDQAFVVEFHGDVTQEEARGLLASEDLTVVEHPDLAASHALVLGGVDEMAKLKGWDEVAYVFPAPVEMITGERYHQCPGALSAGSAVAQFVRVGHGWSPDASGTVNLGFAFGLMTSKVPDDVVKSEIIRAMNEWAKVAKVQFSPVASLTAPRTIAIKFAAGDHGDGYPFDGPNGILAHTFYPSNPEPLAGDLHLDAAEGWHAGTNIDVYTVALHELGHALGLGHSDQPGAIMYPYYRFPSQLGVDDIAGAQAIYGAAAASSPAAPAPGTPVTSTMLVTVVEPAGGLVPVNTTAINLAGTTARATGTASVSWQTDHGASGRATGSTAWIATAIPTPVGPTTVTVTAIDSAHRTATKSITVTRPQPVVQDAIPPVLAVVSPALTAIQTSAASLAVTGTASDNVGVARVTWQTNFGTTGTATGTANWSVPAIPLLVGTNMIVVRAYDAAGNSSWRSLTVVRR